MVCVACWRCCGGVVAADAAVVVAAAAAVAIVVVGVGVVGWLLLLLLLLLLCPFRFPFSMPFLYVYCKVSVPIPKECKCRLPSYASDCVCTYAEKNAGAGNFGTEKKQKGAQQSPNAVNRKLIAPLGRFTGR